MKEKLSSLWAFKSWTFWFNILFILFGVYAPMPDLAKLAIITGATANIFLRLKTQMKIDLKNDGVNDEKN